jgi:hypothetical protein
LFIQSYFLIFSNFFKMKKLFVILSFLALGFSASAANGTATVDEACTACASSSNGTMQCAASPDGCFAALIILNAFLE